MRLDDPALPAVRHLVGGGAMDVLRPPIEATGGTIHDVRVVNVQYRPGSDVVVRYSVDVAWGDAEPTRETLVAASAVHRQFPGVVNVTADAPTGPIEVAVWRWPYDPIVVGLGDAVTPSRAAGLVGLSRDEVRLDIVAYRPTERAVVRVCSAGGAVAYVKAVAPHRAADIAARHDALLDVGVPAPPVLLADAERGLVVMEAISGPTFRDVLKAGPTAGDVWPGPDAIVDVCRRLGTASMSGRGPASRLGDGILHARMLATVAPSLADDLDALSAAFDDLGPAPIDGVVHGDLHEGQLVLADGDVVGLLDVDDAGPGATVDDVANLLARLHYREVTGSAGDLARLAAFHSDFERLVSPDHDARRLAAHTSAALVGLATGPFRIQREGWIREVTQLIDRARRVSGAGTT